MKLPKLWPGISSPPVAFMLRVGSWMVDCNGIHREVRTVSTNGKIINRRWRTLYPKTK